MHGSAVNGSCIYNHCLMAPPAHGIIKHRFPAKKLSDVHVCLPATWVLSIVTTKLGRSLTNFDHSYFCHLSRKAATASSTRRRTPLTASTSRTKMVRRTCTYLCVYVCVSVSVGGEWSGAKGRGTAAPPYVGGRYGNVAGLECGNLVNTHELRLVGSGERGKHGAEPDVANNSVSDCGLSESRYVYKCRGEGKKGESRTKRTQQSETSCPRISIRRRGPCRAIPGAPRFRMWRGRCVDMTDERCSDVSS